MNTGIWARVVRRVPWLTLAYTAVIVWAYQQPDSWQRFSMKGAGEDRASEWFTQTLAHDGLAHLVGNLVVLVLCGWAIEHYLGRIRLVLLVAVSTVGLSLIELRLGWLDSLRSTGGVSAVGMALAAAMVFVGAKVALKTYRGEVNDFEPVVGLLSFGIAALSLGTNIAAQGYDIAPSGTLVAWGAHNLGWVLGLLMGALTCVPYLARPTWSAAMEMREERRRRRDFLARIAAHAAQRELDRQAEMAVSQA